MSNTFDQHLPKTTTYKKEGQFFVIKNSSFFVNFEEGKAMAELLVYAMNDKSTRALLIDNRDAKGAWPREISEIWEQDKRYINSILNKKIATLTSSAVTTMQTNRLSKDHGLENTSRAFNSEFTDEVKDFLLN